MSQLSLFDSPKPRAERRPPNLTLIRKHLNRVLRLVRDAETMPWNEPETKSWERQFPELSHLLPPEEGETMRAEFEAEMERLKAA